MSDWRKVKRSAGVRGKMRYLTKTKWELPDCESKPYWEKVCQRVESQAIRVRNPLPFPTLIYPAISSSIRYPSSSASCDDINIYDTTKHHLSTQIVDASVIEPIVKVYPPSPPSRDYTSSEQHLTTVKFQSNPNPLPNDPIEPSKYHWRLTKLSKMTKLVNEFLSCTRTRVRPTSFKTTSESVSINDPSSTTDKSFDDQSKDLSQFKCVTRASTSQDQKEPLPTNQEANLERRAIGFKDKVELLELPQDIASSPKPIKRPRAPSLSVASAVPSFGKVVISIESISSAEDDEDHGKSKEHHPTKVLSKDSTKPTDPIPMEAQNVPKISQQFLRVPEVRSTSAYPIQDRSKINYQTTSNKSQIHSSLSEEAFKSKLIEESQVLRKKYGFWPKRSIANVFHALKAMRHGLRSKARIESETNRFFAAPLEAYSPSGRSSISSDDRTDFIDVNPESRSDYNDEMEETSYRDGSGENVYGKSESSSYKSVREKLMRNATAHLAKHFQDAGDVRDSKDTILDTNLSSLHNSYDTSDVLKVNRNNRKTSGTCCISVPPMASIFPRIKADKCLACMCKSVKETNESKQQVWDIFSYSGDEVGLGKEPFEISEFPVPSRESLDQLYSPNGPNQIGVDSRYELTSKDGLPEDHQDSVQVGPISSTDTAIGTLTRTISQIDLTRSRAVAKSPLKILASAKSLISDFSLTSEHSKSVSDQDDSDQGCIDPGGTEIRQVGDPTSKYLAPCHMPINLKPSLEPLKALRQKKSRSIQSRVASAEKEVDSANDDEDDNDDEAPVDAARDRLDAIKSPRRKAHLGESNLTDEDQNRIVSESSKIDELIEDQRLGEFDDLMNYSFQQTPIISDLEVINISLKCIQENKSMTEILQILGKEYSKRLSDKSNDENEILGAVDIRKNEKIAKNLLTLLVDSRSYLNRSKWGNETSDLLFSSKQPPLCNSRQLRRVLPLKSYNLVAPILGMAEWYPRRKSTIAEATKRAARIADGPESRRYRHKENGDKGFDLKVHPPSRMEHRVSFEKTWEAKRPKINPYSMFLMKPRRKAVTWRPLTERDMEGYDPEATLNTRAANITDRICQDFCQWLESLAAGTNQASGIDVDVLKDMFETDFSAEVCRTMQVSINEMPMVPSAVAIARNCPEAAELALTRKHLIMDAKAESKPKRTIGFGKSLPDHLKFVPPRNHVREKWLQCKYVPVDLETMDAVWKDITHLNSVKGFINWLDAHPEVKRPKALDTKLLSKQKRPDLEAFKHLELDLDQIQNLKVGDNDPDAS